MIATTAKRRRCLPARARARDRYRQVRRADSDSKADRLARSMFPRRLTQWINRWTVIIRPPKAVRPPRQRVLYVIRHRPSEEREGRALCGVSISQGIGGWNVVLTTKNPPRSVKPHERHPTPGIEAPCLECDRRASHVRVDPPRRAATDERKAIRAERRIAKIHRRKGNVAESTRAFAWLDEDRDE